MLHKKYTEKRVVKNKMGTFLNKSCVLLHCVSEMCGIWRSSHCPCIKTHYSQDIHATDPHPEPCLSRNVLQVTTINQCEGTIEFMETCPDIIYQEHVQYIAYMKVYDNLHNT